MFVQIIKGRIADEDLLRRQVARWVADIRPGATGFLGSTFGISPDGIAVEIARFDSEANARANSARPDQSAWWASTALAFDGEVTFYDCPEVDLFLDGGSDDAGFVQVIEGRALDPEAVRADGRTRETDLPTRRPDVLGGFVAWHDDNRFAQVVYFTSLEEARAAEASMADGDAAQMSSLIDGPLTFTDLPHPEYA